MLRIIRISGDSLSPDYLEGDFVITSRIPYFFLSPQHDDVIVFKQPPHGIMIKRVDGSRTNAASVFVVGTHPDSHDSRHFGLISPQCILGKVIWHIARPRK